MRRLKTVRRPPIYPKTPGHLPCSSLTHPLPLSSRRPSVSFGGFGLSGPEVYSPRFSFVDRNVRGQTGDIRPVISWPDHDVDGISIAFGAAYTGATQVISDDLKAGWAVVVVLGVEHHAI